jgi:hypothetical protein
MPTHYRPDVIGLAIGSVLKQTEPDFELLVVGDGAAPGTADIVQGFADPRLRWFDFPKAPGYGYANRNRALAESRGSLIAFCADDDLWFPDHLERLAACFADGAVQWACSPALWVSADGVVAPDLTNLHFGDERAYFETRANSLSWGCAAYRADAFDRRDAIPDVAQAGDWQLFRDLLRRYGPGGLARQPVPTLLHFTAGRKERRDSGFPLLRGFLAVADRAPWWPPALRAEPGAGASLQAYFAPLLQRPDSVAALRTGAADVVARVALDALSPRAPSTLPGRAVVRPPRLLWLRQRLPQPLKRAIRAILRPVRAVP